MPKRKPHETPDKERLSQKRQKVSGSAFEDLTSPRFPIRNTGISQGSAKKSTPRSSKPAPNADSSSGEDDDAAHLEDTYLYRRERQEQSAEKATPLTQRHSDRDVENGENEGSEGDESGSDGGMLLHESLHADGPSKHIGSKKRYVPEGETRERRDARTIFIGNLPIEAAKGKVNNYSFCIDCYGTAYSVLF